MRTEEEQLATVLVVAYNAERYILDLLESIKNQGYSKMELIIADDHSRDETVEKTRQWLLMNGGRFVRTQLLVSECNKGTVRNLNNALRYCTGKYIKLIAADDILLPDCITDCVRACRDNKWEILVGEAEWVQEDGVTYAPHHEDRQKSRKFYEMDAEGQQRELLRNNDVICTPTAFYTKEFLDRYYGFDEQYMLIEDYPFWLRITADGVQINHLDKTVVKYRQSMTSATNPEKAVQIYNARISKDSKKIFYRQRMKGLLKNGQIRIVMRNIRRYLIRDLVILLGNNSKNKLCYALTRFE